MISFILNLFFKPLAIMIFLYFSYTMTTGWKLKNCAIGINGFTCKIEMWILFCSLRSFCATQFDFIETLIFNTITLWSKSQKIAQFLNFLSHNISTIFAFEISKSLLVRRSLLSIILANAINKRKKLFHVLSKNCELSR